MQRAILAGGALVKEDAGALRAHADFSGLAEDYARHRAGYAPRMPGRLLALARPPGAEGRALDVVDVGAGTGIWTRMLAAEGCHTRAVEPNADMLEAGRRTSAGFAIEWVRGTAESTGLAEKSCDLLTMASAFHWTDFELATREFVRVLRPGGLFAALWNTRVIESDPLFGRVEAELRRLVPRYRPVSSGRSASCEGLARRLSACGRFRDVRYLEDRHVERMSAERYVGIWRSVNDVRVQAGEAVFARFLARVEELVGPRDELAATYTTRVWAARVPGGGAEDAS